MEWLDKFASGDQPNYEEIAAYIDSPLWEELNTFLQDSYDVQPDMSYSSCAGQPGWNVKYKKAGRSLCTLYPMKGFFIALVVIGTKEYEETLEVLPSCTDYTQKLFDKTDYSAMGRWLMIHVTSEAILDDVKRLIQVRRKIRIK